jgi:hypothetical protein
VFLGDGDAMALSTRRLMTVLTAIRAHLPTVRRISSYCLPRNVRNKSVAELTELRAAGLSLAYVGAESGDDTVLQNVHKGETFESTRDALDKLGAAGITRSVMLLNGLGGRVLSRQHAQNSARLANATQPEFLATLVVSFPQGEARFRAAFPGLGAAGPTRPVRRDGAFSCRRWSSETHGVPQRPRLQLAGAQGHAGRREGAPAGAGAHRHRPARRRPAAAGLGAGFVARPAWVSGVPIHASLRPVARTSRTPVLEPRPEPVLRFNPVHETHSKVPVCNGVDPAGLERLG